MNVTLETMTEAEYSSFFRTSLEHHADELMREENMSKKAAETEARKELAEMLPQGYATADNYLLNIKAQGHVAGYLWFLTEINESVPQAFICDILVFDEYRRKGCGRSALSEMEKLAKNMHCKQCVLFVEAMNTAAMSLYTKCGYHILHEHSYGYFMIKETV